MTVSLTLFQRLFGYGDLVIDNASEEGGLTLLHNVPSPRKHAELLLRELPQ
ncbi:MAG: PH domain-containing protein [Pyrinomonadaceae bacterium]